MQSTDNGEYVSPLLIVVIAASISILIVNLYFAQPLVVDIAHDLNIKTSFAGSVISASQFGYALGLFFVVPLSDIVENRKLVIACGTVACVGTIGIATASSAIAFLGCTLLVGVFSSGAQVLIPFLSHILRAKNRGKVLGAVMAAVLVSVTLARPFALFIADTFGWRAIYWISAVATVALGVALALTMPIRIPNNRASYGSMLRSMRRVFSEDRKVPRRTAYQAILFALFTMFWTVTPIMLGDSFGLSQTEIGLFTLAGIGGAFAAPIAGMISDRRMDRIGTVAACTILALAYAGSIVVVEALILVPLVIAAILIDGSIQTSQTISRLVILNVPADKRGRVNAMYMTITYFSGALGSIIGVWLYVAYGWVTVAMIAANLAIMVAVAAWSERFSSAQTDLEKLRMSDWTELEQPDIRP